MELHLCLLTLTVFLTTVRGCTHTFTQLGDYCYGYIATPKTWIDAQNTCKALNGFLAEPKTHLENIFLKGLVEDHNGGDAWLGATDMVTEGKWVWAHHGDALSEYTDWYPGEPSGTGDCAVLWDSHKHHWDDRGCGDKKSFVCQMPASDEIVG